ncbi:hypothetical protein Pmani_007033 [Petrolisthes manimaculis]|uniref:Uncharacterized protein n=1 Tax=Petrolisthes manimaculis TaxID=1843537 RepID=A0AAE1QBF8_9EUCA|nr:hypothetical protein Pmani_007033 [Petrolisthes manimaculis]
MEQEQEQSDQLEEALQEQQRELQLGMQGQLDTFVGEIKEEQQQFKEEVYGELQHLNNKLKPQISEPYGNGGGPIKRIPQKFDGKVSWEAYRLQLELLADQNGWDDRQRAVQLKSVQNLYSAGGVTRL